MVSMVARLSPCGFCRRFAASLSPLVSAVADGGHRARPINSQAARNAEVAWRFMVFSGE
jgi:hypothetical protein